LASFGVGERLREERVRQGLSLADIATQTRISERFLEAIEAQDFDRLPGLVFTRNFVRQYASALKTDAEPLLAQLPRVDIERVPLPDPPLRSRRSDRDPRWTSLFASLGWIVLTAAAGTAGYLYLGQPIRTFVESRKEAKPANSVAVVHAAEKLPAAAAPPEPVARVEQAAVPAPPAALNEAAPSAAPVSRAVEVTLTARESAWVQVTADGRTAFTGTLKPNDSRSVAADALVKVLTGNAGGLEISLNGKPIDPIGPPGQVRTVRLTPEGAELILKTPPPEPDPL